jgi:hypothetical protein
MSDLSPTVVRDRRTPGFPGGDRVNGYAAVPLLQREGTWQMAMVLRTVVYGLGKPVGALLLGGVLLSQIAALVGPANGRAIVHVSTTPVIVSIDEAFYRVESLYETPVVRELRPGDHVVRMLRDGWVLYQADFQVVAGEDTVLVAWEEHSDGRDPGKANDRFTRPRSAPGSSPGPRLARRSP